MAGNSAVYLLRPLSMSYRQISLYRRTSRAISKLEFTRRLHGNGSDATNDRRRRVVVTGMGLVTPLGTGSDFVFGRLLAGDCGVIAMTGAEYSRLPCRVAAPVPPSFDPIATRLVPPAEMKKMSRATVLALHAAEEALSDASWTPTTPEQRERTGVAIGVGMVPLSEVVDTGLALRGESNDNSGYNKVSPFFVTRILTNMTAGHIAIRHGLHGPNHAVSTACATGAHAVGDAFRFVRTGDADVMVCGGAEACIEPLAMAGFSRMRALSTAFNHEPSSASRPFDRRRDGFVMGEGAGILILEELEHARRRNARIHAEVLGYGLSGDAHHVSAPHADGRGAFLSMRAALTDAGLETSRIGYVNAHATSTPLGDAAEVSAIKRLFAASATHLAVSSTKGAIGHLLGAAGCVEAIFTVLACARGTVPPTINLKEPGDGLDLNFVPLLSQPFPNCGQDGRNFALTNSFGFGGTNTTLCFGSL